MAILILPLAVGGPSYLHGELRRANGGTSVIAPPYKFPLGQFNKALAAGVVAHVPAHAQVAAVGSVELDRDGARWLAYVIAPRQLTTDRAAHWWLVFGETPQQAHLDHGVRGWRYGKDWLVER
jgi:hypothetical protein